MSQVLDHQLGRQVHCLVVFGDPTQVKGKSLGDLRLDMDDRTAVCVVDNRVLHTYPKALRHMNAY